MVGQILLLPDAVSFAVAAVALAFSVAAVYWGVVSFRMFKGEFMSALHWITFGFILLVIGLFASVFGFLLSAESGDVLRFFGQNLTLPAVILIIIGYKKIYDLLSQMA